MQWDKELVGRVLDYSFPMLSYSEIELFLFSKVKVFRQRAIFELLRRCEWSQESSDYLINLLSFHLSQKSLLSLRIPRPLLEKCLEYPFINPTLAIIIHGCLGFLNKSLSKNSLCFLNVVCHLTNEGLPYIFLAQVSAYPELASDMFKYCLTLTDVKIQLESLLLVSNYLNGVQRRRVISLLTPECIVDIQARPIFNMALSLVNNDIFLAVLNQLISLNYVSYSPKTNNCGFGLQPAPPRLTFTSSLWRRLQTNHKYMIVDRLIAMFYQHSHFNFAILEWSSLSAIMEGEYCIRMFDETCNNNLLFPIKYYGTGRSATNCSLLFRRILPNIWKYLNEQQHERAINLVLYLVQADKFREKVFIQDSLKCFIDILSEKNISDLIIRLIKLVKEYNSEDVSTNIDDIIFGVSISLNLLESRLNMADIIILRGVVLDWLTAENIKNKILATWILYNIENFSLEGNTHLLIESLLKNLEHGDEEVFLFSSLCLLNLREVKLEPRFAMRCIDLFSEKYDRTNPQYHLKMVLLNIRKLFLSLEMDMRNNYLSILTHGYASYYYKNKTTTYIALSKIIDLIDTKFFEKVEQNVLFEVKKDYRHSGFGGQGFNELLDGMRFLKSVREAMISICIMFPDNIKYLSEGFRQRIYSSLPISTIIPLLEKIVKNKDYKNSHYVRNDNEFRFFSNRWHEMNKKFQNDTIRFISKKLGERRDHGDLAVVMMLWPKISESEKEEMENSLAKRYPAKATLSSK